MLKSRLFWKLFLAFALVNLLTAAALMSASLGWQREELVELSRRELTSVAVLIEAPAAEWVATRSEDAARRVRELAEQVGATVRVSGGGEELVAGPEPPRGAAEQNTVHAQRPLTDDGGRVVGRIDVTRPGETRAEALAALGERYTRYAAVLAGLVLLVGFGLVSHVVGPVQELDRAARAMAAGAYRQRAFVGNNDELGQLAQSFNRMSEDLGRQLDELRERDHRQATVLGGMIEGVIAIDGRRHVLFANAAAGKLFGFFPPQVEARPLLEAVRNHALHQAVTAAIESRTPQRLEIDWEERVMSVQVTPLVGDKTTGAIVVMHDTTELRRLENLRRDFVANVSHELKTPLSAIKANAETLLRGAVDDLENRGRFLQGIDVQADRLSVLIQDMLSLARIESAQQPFAIHAVPIAPAVQECLQDYEQQAEVKGVALAAAGPDGRPDVRVKADPEGLRIILNNLVDNAIKYTPAGGAVRVSWSETDGAAGGPPGVVRIQVADTGVGIPGEKIARVFERFYRVDEARSREMGGTGLGLSIVKHLAQSFGGSVSVDSRPKEGSRFVVTLPAA
ncbi:ATP-binding protein [Botrimarina sp.]|uniref:HAMP domain-containing sensor histidine kinase n=1 Tax=Botrimarina sp. TaxID=2795802 RepID=UPI0032EDF14F